MEEVAVELLKPVGRVILACARFLLWLAWDFAIQIIGWSIGWCICRLFSFGHFPKEGISDPDSASFLTSTIIELIGLASLFLTIVLLNTYLPL